MTFSRHSVVLWMCVILAQCGLTVALRGQTLIGTVLASVTNKPLPGVRILLLETKRGALSRADGSFVLPLVGRGEHTLRVSLLGFAPIEERITVSTTDTMRIVLRLKQTAVRFATARVVADRIVSDNLPTQNTTTITMQELERSRGQTLGESLQNIAGITLLQTGASIAKPVIRGLHSQRIVIVNAGVQQEGQQWGAEHAPEIDPFAAQQIQVVRGAAGVEYGAGAMGGVIRVEPRHVPQGAWFGGEALAALFSNNSQGAVALALEGGSIELGEKNTLLNDIGNGFGWRVQGSARKAGDSRTPNYVIGNTGFQELNGSVAFGYTNEKLSIEAYYSLFTTELGIFRGAHIGNLNDLLRAIEAGKPLIAYDWTYSIANPKQQISHDLWSLKVKYDASFGQFEMQYGWQQNNRAEFDSHNARIRGDSGLLLASLDRPAMTLQLTTYSLDTKFRQKPLEILLGETSQKAMLTGVIGASGMAQWNVQSGRTFLIPSFEAQSGGVYAIQTLTTREIIANLGLRYDAKQIAVRGSSSRDIPDTMQAFTGLSAAAGVVWFPQFLPITNDQRQMTDNCPLSLALNLGATWRSPLVNEQFSLGVHHGTAQYEIGNAKLTSERSYNADVTLAYKTDAVRIELSGFANIIENFIYLRPDAQNPTVTIRGTFPTFFYTQTLAFLHGVDGSIDAALASNTSENLRVGGTFSLVRGDNLADQEPLIFMPADRLRVFLRYEREEFLGMKDIFLEASSMLVRRQDRFPANSDYTVPPEGYVLFDVSAGSTLEWLGAKFLWNVAVRNVMNTAFRDYLSRYRYFTDDAGRNVVLRVSVPFGDGR
ncbi:MAG: TonB-dependent receptor [Ignavibacteria bacterium]|nr:TonB-dependent receptor [Ignavibacteria bacterium]